MDLQAAFPESKGFSTSNLWRMKQWYLFYADSEEKLAQLGREITDAPSANNNGVPFPDYFAYVPWKHHVEIVTKSKTIEEALFYIVKCATEGWSRNTLANCRFAATKTRQKSSMHSTASQPQWALLLTTT